MDNIFLMVVVVVVIIIILHVTINNHKKSIESFTTYKNKLSIMAIFKNEELYLEEWLQHHIKEGINHFYLYSNDKNMEKYKFLDKYTDKITLIPWTNVTHSIHSTVQRDAYTHCIQNYINKYDFNF